MSDDLKRLAVDRLSNTAISPDGREVHVLLQGGGDDHIVLEFDTVSLGQILADLTGAAAQARQKDPRSNAGVVAAPAPARWRVGRAEGENDVVLSFQMPNGLEYHFALPPIAAKDLRRQIGDTLMRGKPAKPFGTAH